MFPFYLVLLSGTVIAAALLVAFHLPDYQVSIVRAPAENVLAYLARELRRSGYRVKENPGHVAVRIGRVAAVKLHVRSTPDGSEVAYQADATPSGWGNLITLVVLVWTAIPAIAAILLVFLRDRSFVVHRILPILSEDRIRGERRRPQDVRALLVDGLAEGHRLAEEAYETDRASYWASLMVIAFAAAITWVLLFLTLIITSTDTDPSVKVTNAVWGATIPSVALPLLPGWLVRRKIRPRLMGYRNWGNRLRDALVREVKHEVPEAAEPSAFELLTDASFELPAWLEVRRRAGIGQDPGAGSLILTLASMAVVTAFAAAWSVSVGSVAFSLFFALLSFGLGLAAYLFHGSWNRRQKGEASRTVAEWQRRAEGIRRQMERNLENL